MHIALVTTSWPAAEFDPAGHFVRAHARALERQGHRVTVVAPAAGGAFGWPGAAARIRERPIRSLDAARWIARARRSVSRMQVDRVVAHWSVPCGWPIATASHAALDLVSHGADVRTLAALPGPLRRGIVRALADRAAAWDFASDALMRELLDALDPTTGARLERVARVRPPPIELPDVAEAIAARRGELAGVPTAVCVGRLVATKRVDRIIRRVAKEHLGTVLVVVGDGPERSRLEQLARACGVTARFVGAVDRREALTWIGAADLLFHASEAEGLSTVVREASALGTRVVRLTGSPPCEALP